MDTSFFCLLAAREREDKQAFATCSEGLCSWMTRCTVALEMPWAFAIWPRLQPRWRSRRMDSRSDQAALLFDGTVDWFSSGRGFLEPIAKLLIGFLKTLPMTRVIAAELSDDEAENGG